jgi:hypothetical protein
MSMKVVLAAIVGIAIGMWLSSNGVVVPYAAPAVGADINFVLECHGIEGKLGAIIGNFDRIEEYEQNKKNGRRSYNDDDIKTYYPRVGIAVEGGMVKMGDVAMPKARIDNASATRIEFTADIQPNAIPFTRHGQIDRLSGEVEFHDEIFGGGADAMKYKSQWLFRCNNARPKF